MHALKSLAAATVVVGMFSGCPHTTETKRVTETIRTEPAQPAAVVPPPVTEESSTVIRRSHTKTEEGQP